MKRSHNAICRRRESAGFTLFELIASLGAASVLMVGLSSALFIAVQSVDVNNSPQLKVLEAQEILADMCADLQYATSATETAVNAVTLSIPDRDDADALPDTVRYAWAGQGNELTRQYNGGTAIPVADTVHNLNFSYSKPDGALEFITIELQLINDPNVIVVTKVSMLNRP